VAGLDRHHATIFVAPAVAGPIEDARREWDPTMAARIPAHVTLVYPEEAPRPDLLIARVRTAAGTVPPFRLRLGEAAGFASPEGGAYLSVDDVDGGVSAIREVVLQPPFRGIPFRPHVTIVHPGTSPWGRRFLEQGGCRTGEREFTVAEVAITAFDGTRWVGVHAFPLSRPR